MTHRQKQHLTISGIVASATIVISALGVLANGVIDLNKKSQMAVDGTASNMQTISRLVSMVNEQEIRLARLEGRHLRHHAVVDTIAVTPAEQPGLVRRIFRMLF